MDRAEFIAKLKKGDRVWFQQGVWIQEVFIIDAGPIWRLNSLEGAEFSREIYAEPRNLFPSLDAAIEGMISEKNTLSLSGQALVLALQLVTAYGNPEEFRSIAAEICSIGEQFYRSIGGD